MFLPSNITLQFGDSGDFVAELQRRLAMVRCFSEDQVNGFFDGATVSGVTQFQTTHGLRGDGVAGPETLRRLNGVIAGDTSWQDDKKEEEAVGISPAEALTNDIMQRPQELEPAFYSNPSQEHAPYGEAAYAAPAPAPIAAPEPPPAPAISETQRAQEQIARDIQLQQLQQPQVPLQPDITQLLQQQQPQQQPLQAAAQQQAPQPLAAAQHEPAAEAQAAEPRGIVGRARQFASGMLQKLNDYFEAKLPPSVMAEVQSIGLTMARSGMKEAPIPTGPEMAQRGPELPTRGPEQVQQRG